jgi:uncharacterized protein YdcH (DUF465 family)
MNSRFYRLLERLQKLDARLRHAQTMVKSDPLEVARLRAQKLTLRERLSRPAAPRLAFNS